MSTFADELLQEAAIEVELSEAKARGTLPGQRMKWPGATWLRSLESARRWKAS